MSSSRFVCFLNPMPCHGIHKADQTGYRVTYWDYKSSFSPETDWFLQLASVDVVTDIWSGAQPGLDSRP